MDWERKDIKHAHTRRKLDIRSHGIDQEIAVLRANGAVARVDRVFGKREFEGYRELHDVS
jgi:hypothetical protein